MCPNCKHPHTPIPLDESKEVSLCGRCGMTFRMDMTPMVNIFQAKPADERPDLPTNAGTITNKHLVIDFHTDDEGVVTFTSRVYLPKEDVVATEFNPDDPKFKFAMKVHRKRFKNRRRYMYEKQRKMANVS